jgi:hypothetical protein
LEGKKHARNVDPLMNPTISLTNQIPRIIQKLVLEFSKEEIIPDHVDSNTQLLLRLTKIKLDIELFEEIGDGIRVLILFRLDHLDDFPYGVSSSTRR